MNFLKEPLRTLSFPAGFSDTYDALLEKLKAMNFGIRMQDKQSGEITINCLCKMFDVVFWRCWANRLHFKVSQIEESKTEVEIYGLPDFFRIRVKKREKLTDINKLSAQLSMIELGEANT
jgi:hypothetical protein